MEMNTSILTYCKRVPLTFDLQYWDVQALHEDDVTRGIQERRNKRVEEKQANGNL
jgi:hypothetical protein